MTRYSTTLELIDFYTLAKVQDIVETKVHVGRRDETEEEKWWSKTLDRCVLMGKYRRYLTLNFVFFLLFSKSLTELWIPNTWSTSSCWNIQTPLVIWSWLVLCPKNKNQERGEHSVMMLINCGTCRSCSSGVYANCQYHENWVWKHYYYYSTKYYLMALPNCFYF